MKGIGVATRESGRGLEELDWGLHPLSRIGTTVEEAVLGLRRHFLYKMPICPGVRPPSYPSEATELGKRLLRFSPEHCMAQPTSLGHLPFFLWGLYTHTHTQHFNNYFLAKL